MPLKEAAHVNDCISLLNDLLDRDPAFAQALVGTRFQCNRAVLEHPTVQCSARNKSSSVGECGLLGVLNGIFGAHDDTGWGQIGADFDDAGNLTGFRIITREEHR